MTWIIIGGVAVVAFVLGLLVRGGRGRSPIEEYERRQRNASLATELAERAGTMDEVRLLVAKGNKLAAIKAFRQQTNCGLREAKEAVEALEREQRSGS